jgi:two-component system, NtrC family, response regulator AtoC
MSNLGAENPAGREDQGFVAGLSSPMQTLENVLADIAPTNIPILFVGESGTGKEVFANRVHRLSRHRETPFLRISCASMNPITLAAALGLSPNGRNRSAESAAGTAFFDEISELDAACQRHLLYALPEGEGAPGKGSLTARVVSATSRNLDEEMSAGRFRNELYYRVNGICLRLPPLRERKEDIPPLVEWFLSKHAAQLGRPRPSLSPRTLELFLAHSWPGNIRELENVVKKIVALGDEHLAIAEWEAVPSEARAVAAAAPRPPAYSLKAASRAASREAERELILKALARTHWNRKRAAQELQVSYKSLLHKLKQIAVDDRETD